jgi:hypothetical protein
METLKTPFRSFALIAMMLLPLLTLAGPGRRHSQTLTAVGFRAGWAGAPNGITVRAAINEFSAFEFVAGVNNKTMRRSEYHNGIWQFDSYIGASWQPTFMAGDDDLSVGFYGDFGVRARIHHHRFHYAVQPNPITPDVIGGAGMIIQTGSIQLFADIHAKYTDNMGAYVPGLESGLGLRINLN